MSETNKTVLCEHGKPDGHCIPCAYEWWRKHRDSVLQAGFEASVSKRVIEADKPHKARPWGYKGPQVHAHPGSVSPEDTEPRSA